MRCCPKLLPIAAVFTTMSVLSSCLTASAQATPPNSPPKDALYPALLVGSLNPVRFAHNVSSDTFWLIGGGSAEFSSPAMRHFSAVVNVYGGRASYKTAQSDSMNLMTYTFGPRYTFVSRSGKYSFFGEGLVGEARGYNLSYPPGVGSSSARSLAFLTGAGADVKVTKHFGWRALEVDYLRTQLPVTYGSPQDNLRVGTGIVFRLDYRHAR